MFGITKLTPEQKARMMKEKNITAAESKVQVLQGKRDEMLAKMLTLKIELAELRKELK